MRRIRLKFAFKEILLTQGFEIKIRSQECSNSSISHTRSRVFVKENSKQNICFVMLSSRTFLVLQMRPAEVRRCAHCQPFTWWHCFPQKRWRGLWNPTSAPCFISRTWPFKFLFYKIVVEQKLILRHQLIQNRSIALIFIYIQRIYLHI